MWRNERKRDRARNLTFCTQKIVTLFHQKFDSQWQRAEHFFSMASFVIVSPLAGHEIVREKSKALDSIRFIHGCVVEMFKIYHLSWNQQSVERGKDRNEIYAGRIKYILMVNAKELVCAVRTDIHYDVMKVGPFHSVFTRVCVCAKYLWWWSIMYQRMWENRL